MKHEHENYFVKRYVEPLTLRSHFQFIKENIILEPLKFKELLVTEQTCISLVVLNFDNEFFLYYPFEVDGLEPIDVPSDEKAMVFNNLTNKKHLFAYTGQTLALIYEGKKVKLFEHYKEGKSIEVKFNAQPQMIVGKSGQFHVLLKDGSGVLLNENGEVLDEKVDEDLFERSMPTIDKEIKFEKFGFDCAGDLWVLEEESHIIHYFFKTLFYEKTYTETLLFDSFDNYTSWSNLYVDCDLPMGTKVSIEIRVDDGQTQTFTNLFNLLLYELKGEVLYIKITLESDESERLSPTINTVRVTFNEKPYIDYLPAYYQHDKENLSRYLSIFQDIMHDFETTIEKSSELLNPMLCDEEYLSWLSSLLGVQRDYRWEEKRWRKFLTKLPHLYRGLGTKKVMQEAIALYCDEEPVIEDAFENKLWTFCVTLSAEKLKERRDIEVIENIIESFKPAHTTGRLVLDDKEHYIVEKSFLSMNTKVKG